MSLAIIGSAPLLRQQAAHLEAAQVPKGRDAPKKGDTEVPVSTHVSTLIQSAEGNSTSWSKPGDGLKLRCGISA
mgnify:CR=1 FL=1